MKKYLFKIIALLVFVSFSCDKVEVTSPGNNQNLDPKPPVGEIDWSITVVDGNGQLPENTAAGKTIGTLSATDPNPDDEFEYVISSQKIDNTSVNYFVISSDSEGINSLELSNGSINYEALSGSKQVDVVILVTDDSPEPQSNDFSITIDITDVNETPYFTNLNSIVRFADEYVDYSGTRIEWTDTDEGDNPVFSTSSLPSWLSISNDGQMSTNAPVTSDVGNHSFLLKISDGYIEVQEEITIEVRQNSAPVFTNVNSIPASITVGCYSQNQSIFDINWYDPNNNSPHFNGNDLITFSVIEDVPWMNINENGSIFCVTAPDNNDAATSAVTISIIDNRPAVPLATQHEFSITVIPNVAPTFTNLDNLAASMSINDESYEFDIDHSDLDENQVTYQLRVDTYLSTQLSWVNLNSTTGALEINPTQNNIGSHELVFTISDGCLSTEEEKSFTILGN